LPPQLAYQYLRFVEYSLLWNQKLGVRYVGGRGGPGGGGENERARVRRRERQCESKGEKDKES